MTRPDLNLLRLLDTLIRERSVSRTAARLNVTQPAVSFALSKLRHQLGDPLLVRTRDGMQPTERALALAAPVREALDALERALGSHLSFDPATAVQPIKIAAADYAGIVLLPGLLNRLLAAAPNMQQTLQRINGSAIEAALAAQECDLVFSTAIPHDRRLEHSLLFSDPLVVVTRPNHPGIGARLTLKKYLALPHVLTAPAEQRVDTAVDDALLKLGLHRRIAMVLPQSRFVNVLNADSDFVGTISVRVARVIQRSQQVALHKPPAKLPPSRLFLLWHRKFQNDARHRWLREQVIDEASRH
ncbi:MAG: LysR family transcriptional regulator [Betaproteobacteria bacterium]|nr:LysR family transcriptional regulator [Betaproteobacteria bacterium]